MPVITIARTVVLEALRQRSAIGLVALLAFLTLLLPHLVDDGATLSGRFRLLVTYGVGLAFVVVAVATVLLAAGSLSKELENRTIDLVATKPLRRHEIVLGKFTGIVILDAALVLVVLGFFGAHVLWLRSSSAPAGERALLSERFLTARSALHPRAEVDEAEVERRVLQRLESRERDDGDAAPPEASSPAGGAHEHGRDDGHDHGHRAARREAADRATLEAVVRRALRLVRVPPGEERELRFPGEEPRAPQGRRRFLRYVFRISPPGGDAQVPIVWRFGAAESAPEIETDLAPGVPHELAVPPGLSGSGADFVVTVRNPADGEGAPTLMVDPEEVELLVPSGDFWWNVLRAGVLLSSQLALLSAVALAAGALVTFPTATLLGCVVLVGGLASDYLAEVIQLEMSLGAPESVAEVPEWVFARLGRMALLLLPDFLRHDPIGHLVSARAIEAGTLVDGAVSLLLAGCGLSLALAAVAFGRRELGLGESY